MKWKLTLSDNQQHLADHIEDVSIHLAAYKLCKMMVETESTKNITNDETCRSKLHDKISVHGGNPIIENNFEPELNLKEN